jgi:hypothetical protein
MSASRYFKCLCEHCRGRIEFPVEGVGTTVACPHCGEQTDLLLPEADDLDRTEQRARVWAIGGVIVLLLLLVAAFVAVHLLQEIAPQVRQARGVRSRPSLPAKPAIAAQSASDLTSAATLAESSPPAEWLRTNELAISPIGLAAQPGSTLMHATGTVVNLSTRKRFGLVVEVQLLDAGGNELRQIRDTHAVLEPSARWDFRALVPDPKSKSARLAVVHEAH